MWSQHVGVVGAGWNAEIAIRRGEIGALVTQEHQSAVLDVRSILR
jgi:hypothetical protein